MSNKNDPTLKPGNPKRFVAEADDIEVGGKVRIKSGELPPIPGAKPSTSSHAHPLPAKQKPAPKLTTGRKRP
jgi:hypothetical protein